MKKLVQTISTMIESMKKSQIAIEPEVCQKELSGNVLYSFPNSVVVWHTTVPAESQKFCRNTTNFTHIYVMENADENSPSSKGYLQL